MFYVYIGDKKLLSRCPERNMRYQACKLYCPGYVNDRCCFGGREGDNYTNSYGEGYFVEITEEQFENMGPVRNYD